MCNRWSLLLATSLLWGCDFGEVEDPSGEEIGQPAPGPIEGERLQQGDLPGAPPQWDVRDPRRPDLDREVWHGGLRGVPRAGVHRVPALEESELDHGLEGWFDVSGERSPERERFESYARPPEDAGPREGYGAWEVEAAPEPEPGAPEQRPDDAGGHHPHHHGERGGHQPEGADPQQAE